MIHTTKNIGLAWGIGQQTLDALKPEIKTLLSERKTAGKIFEKLVENHNFLGSKRTIERFVRLLKAQLAADLKASKPTVSQRPSKKVIRRRKHKNVKVEAPLWTVVQPHCERLNNGRS